MQVSGNFEVCLDLELLSLKVYHLPKTGSCIYRWLAKDMDDKLLERELTPSDS